MHPETSGWDLLLARGDLQVGIQAKLRPNLAVLAQALPCTRSFDDAGPGPDVRAVLVPEASGPFRRIARELRITVFDMLGQDFEHVVAAARLWETTEHEWMPPAEVIGIGGGRSGPVQITQWKVAALNLCLRLRARGHVTRADFRELKISPTTWLNSRWLRVDKVGKQWRYTIGDVGPLPDERWPEIAMSLKPALVELDQRRSDATSRSVGAR